MGGATAPIVAWLAAAGMCGGLFALANLLSRDRPTKSRLLGLLALGCLTFSYLLVLGGKSTSLPPRRDALSFITALIMLLGVPATAIVVPALLIAIGLRRERNADSPRVRPGASLVSITLALHAVMFALGFVLLAVTLWMTPKQWRLAAILIFAFGSPVFLLSLWTYMYPRLLSRWEVRQRSPLLSEGLETLHDRTGFVFDRILCLDATYGGGRVCQVVSLCRSTLVMSESIPTAATAEQLLALLAHEAAHVRLNHVRRKVAWGALGAAVALTTAVVGQSLIAPWVPQRLGLVGALVVLLPIIILQGLYDTFVIRRHEAEADEFAVDVAGATALLSALETLGAAGQLAVPVHNRWTTHSTWELRSARIREYGNTHA